MRMGVRDGCWGGWVSHRTLFRMPSIAGATNSLPNTSSLAKIFPAAGGAPALFVDDSENQGPILRPGELSSTPKVALPRDVTQSADRCPEPEERLPCFASAMTSIFAHGVHGCSCVAPRDRSRDSLSQAQPRQWRRLGRLIPISANDETPSALPNLMMRVTSVRRVTVRMMSFR
jgi:hypothetical protein